MGFTLASYFSKMLMNFKCFNYSKKRRKMFDVSFYCGIFCVARLNPEFQTFIISNLSIKKKLPNVCMPLYVCKNMNEYS